MFPCAHRSSDCASQDDRTAFASSPSRAVEEVRWPRRVGWLVLIWLLSVGALALVAGALKLLMTLAGLHA
jgi:hypothetical protein